MFPIFAPKHRLRLLVRTGSPRRFRLVHRNLHVCFEQKYENIKNVLMEFFKFTAEKSLCMLCHIAYGQVFVMVGHSMGQRLFSILIIIILLIIHVIYQQTTLWHVTNYPECIHSIENISGLKLF